MKKQTLLLLICIFCSYRTVFAIACTGGTSTGLTGSIDDGFKSRSGVVASPTTNTATFGSPWRSGVSGAGMRTEYAFLASELTAAGLVAGPITHLAWNVTSVSGVASNLPGYTISMTNGFGDVIGTFDPAGTVVYGPTTEAIPTTTGLKTFVLTTPYMWDGVSSLQITICHGIPSVITVSPDVDAMVTGTTNRCGQSTTAAGCGETTVNSLQFIRPSARLRQEPNYENNAACDYLIAPGGGGTITLNFTEFNTEANFDFVKIYDGPTTASPLLGSFHGDLSGSLPTVTSTSSKVLVKFTTDPSGVRKGWAADYVTNVTCGTATLTGATCGAPQTFSDGSGAALYSNFTNCSWLLNPAAAHDRITLTFTAFETETGSDFVYVYDGQDATAAQVPGSPFSGSSLPPVIHSTGPKLFIVFTSDINVQKNGWDAKFEPTKTPVVTISGNSTICLGELATFTATPTNGGSPNYSWKKNGSPVGTNSNTYSSSTLVNGDVITCEMTSSASCVFPATVTSNAITMLVHALPVVGIITSPNPPSVCEGETIGLTGTGAVTYCWDAGSGPVCANPIGASFPAGTYTVTVTGTDANSCVNTASVALTFNALPVPVITSNTGSFSFCNNSSIILDADVWDAYEWSTGATTQMIATNSGATYTVTVTDANGCTGSAEATTVRVTSVPARPGTIDGPVYGLCNTTGNTFEINPVANADSYLWTVSNGMITSGQGTTIITVDYFGFSSSTITVKAVNACGKSSSRSLTVYAKPAAPLTIHGQKNGVCKKTGELYSVDPVDGASNYKWTVPSGVTIVNGQGTTDLEVNFGNSFSSGNICCRAENSCGNSSYTCLSVKAKPQKPVTIFGPTNVCRHSTHTYSTPSVYGASSYLWTVPSGSVIVSGQGTASIDVHFGTHSGKVEVWAKNSCGTSGDYDLNIHMVCREEGDFEMAEVNAYPNPVHDNLNVSIPSEMNQKCVVKMIDVIGKQMMFDAIDLSEGENIHQYDVSGFAKGLYFIVIEREGMPAQTVRVIVE